MYCILKYGGFTTGVNFDAKVRRESFEPIDLFHAHIEGMDAFARGSEDRCANALDGKIATLLQQRYADWTEGLGAEIMEGHQSFPSLERLVLDQPAIQNGSGRQEFIENLINDYLV